MQSTVIIRLASLCALSACTVLAALAANVEPTAKAPMTLEAMIERVKDDLVKREGLPRDELKTVQADAIVWRDTSLGCGGPNESYAQVEVEGFHIVLEHEGRRFDYRARRDGVLKLCPPPLQRGRRTN